MHGTAKYYYSQSDIIKDEIEFNQGIKEGWHKHYREDGLLESKIHFRNNLQDGDTYWYYPNGNIKEYSYWVNGKQFGLAKWFYENGQLDLLNINDFSGDAIYLIKKDKNGNTSKEVGVVFSPNFKYIPQRDSMPIHGESFIQIAVSEPPETKTTIQMGELGKELKQLKVINYLTTYHINFPDIGKYTLVIIGEIHDLQGNLIKKDSIATEINVVK
ncbi:MAG: hypothetical protein JJU02_06590 [Cryomorphaceae bacterium]|nr:hypothetical protein [Cryomorphaceae bacterium]